MSVPITMLDVTWVLGFVMVVAMAFPKLMELPILSFSNRKVYIKETAKSNKRAGR